MTAQHSDHEIETLGLRWFFGAGLFALLLIAFLVTTDDRMSTSDKEVVLGNTLKRLRTAQAELHTGEVDPRESRASAAANVGLVAVPAEEALHGESAH